MFLTKDVNGSETGRDGEEIKPGKENFGAEVCGEKNWAGGVVVVFFACPFEADVAGGTADIVLRSSYMVKLHRTRKASWG